jgi:hypothetical protein
MREKPASIKQYYSAALASAANETIYSVSSMAYSSERQMAVAVDGVVALTLCH